MQPSEIRRWIRAGDLDKLENVILDGQGQKLLSEYSSDVRTQGFLKTVPAYMARLDILHECVARGRLWDVKILLAGKEDALSEKGPRLVLSKDRDGLGLLHKAVKRGDLATIEWLVENYPNTINVRDKDRRVPIHFCGVSSEPEATWRVLVNAGADTAALDVYARTPAFYMHRPDQFHAQQPRKFPRNQPGETNLKPNVPIQVKPANIRIWIHDQNLGKLKKVLWEGQGDKLRMETSAHPGVRRFLSAVPYVMGVIKDVHQATVQNDLELLRKKTADPVPPEILLSKDANGLNPLHKAAGLGFTDVVRYIVDRCPESVTRLDNEGRTPLHYAAIQKDGQQIFNILQNCGGDEKVLDSRGKNANYYKLKANELDMKVLQTIPSAPRNSSVVPSGWSWEVFNDSETTPSTHSQSQKSDNSVFRSENAEVFNDANNGNDLDTNGIDYQQEMNGAYDEQLENLNEPIEDTNNNTASEPDFKDKSLELQALEGLSNVRGYLLYNKPRTARNVNVANKQPESSSKIFDLHEKMAKTLSGSGTRAGHPAKGNSDSDTSVNESEKDKYVKLEDDRDENPGDENPESKEMLGSPPPNIESGKDLRNDNDEDLNDDAKKNTNEKDESGTNEEPDGKIIDETPDLDAHLPVYRGSEFKSNLTDRPQLRDEILDPPDGGLNEEEVADQNETVDDEGGSEDGPNEPEEGNTADDLHNRLIEGVDIQADSENPEAEGKADEPGLGEELDKDADEESDLHNQQNEGAVMGSGLHNQLSEGAVLESGLPNRPNEGGNDEPPGDETLIKIVDDELRENQELTSQVFETVKKTQGPESEEIAEIASNNSITRFRSVSAIPEAPPISESVVREFDNGVEMTGGEEDSEELEKASMQSRQQAQQLVDEGDVEKLAEMVLNGQGTALLDLTSDEPHVRAFLQAVPSYLAKIESVHKACIEGELRGVQAAVDRRNFAVARDRDSYFKPTPLHVATLFERAPVVEYLASRFPETLHARDAKGRTALHYAATLPDDQIYNLLLGLGADPTLPDEEGYSPEQYLKNRHLLQHSYLMEIYQRETAVGNKESSSDEKKPPTPYPPIGNLQIFGPEDGRYLSQTVGGPLIKGLTEVVNARPENPVKYLGNFLVNYDEPQRETDASLQKGRFEIIASTSRPAIMSSADKNKGYNLQKREIRMDLPLSSPSQEIKSNFNPIARDEFGQSMVHLAAARPHGRNAFFELLVELDTNISLRDALYRTARDIAVLASKMENALSIDKYVTYLVAKGELDKLKELMLDGYDHLGDLEAEEPPQKIAAGRGHEHVVTLFESIKPFQEKRDELHMAIRKGHEAKVEEMVKENPSIIRDLAVAKNIQGRCSLHVALLAQAEDIVKFLVERFPQTLKIGDNLERTPLHYAMALNKVEMVSNILVQAGAERVVKDLKGRQPSYYFMNKSDIHELQDEEKQLQEIQEESKNLDAVNN